MCLEVVAGARQFQGMVLWMVGCSMLLREGVCTAIALPPLPFPPLRPSLPVCWEEPGGVAMWHHVGLLDPSLTESQFHHL